MIPRVCHLTYLQSAKAAKAAKDWDDAQLASNLDECKIAEAKDVKTPAAAAKVCSLDIPLPAVDALLDLSCCDCWRIGIQAADVVEGLGLQLASLLIARSVHN